MNLTNDQAYRNNNLSTAHRDKRGMRSVADTVHTTEPCIVYDYNAEKQTVDVILKSNPKMLPLRDVPIAEAGGDFRIIRPMKTKKGRDANPTVGWVMFPRSDCRGLLEDHEVKAPQTAQKHRSNCPVFVYGIPVGEDPKPLRLGSDYTKDDTAFVHESGSAIIFKSNGDIVISAAGNAYVAGNNGTTGSAAARQGDAGDGTGGSISGGSGSVFIGD